jgi:hypothetical protein
MFLQLVTRCHSGVAIAPSLSAHLAALLTVRGRRSLCILMTLHAYVHMSTRGLKIQNAGFFIEAVLCCGMPSDQVKDVDF